MFFNLHIVSKSPAEMSTPIGAVSANLPCLVKLALYAFITLIVKSLRQQEPIVRVLALSQSPPMRYISVSKRGTLIVWNRHLNNIKPLEVTY